MNFDFIKNIDSLGQVYKYCCNAEELAVSMPYLSECASRITAESIAKYVYSVAHVKEAYDLNFFDILNDPVVKRYLGDKRILAAFHFIRKHGNDAVHNASHKHAEVNPDEAIDVLDDLHFVVGEVAIKMEMISNYPEFDDKLILDTGKTEMLDMDSSEVAKAMYDEYVISNHRIEKLKEEFGGFCSPFIFVPGNVGLHEVLEFKSKPQLDNTIQRLQQYFGTIGNKAIKYLREGTENDREINYELELTIYGEGEKGYKTRELGEAVYGILYDIPSAEGFRICSYYHGPEVSTLFDGEYGEYGMFPCIADELDENEQYEYKKFDFHYNSGAGGCMKKEGGEWIDLSRHYSTDIIDKDYVEDWWTWDTSLVIEFDFEKHGDIIENLHELVRKYVPEEELAFCVDNWDGEDAENEILLDGIQWCPRKLREVQLFLDDVNELISPIKDECKIVADGKWFISKDPLAVAELQIIDGELKITGTEL